MTIFILFVLFLLSKTHFIQNSFFFFLKKIIHFNAYLIHQYIQPPPPHTIKLTDFLFFLNIISCSLTYQVEWSLNNKWLDINYLRKWLKIIIVYSVDNYLRDKTEGYIYINIEVFSDLLIKTQISHHGSGMQTKMRKLLNVIK